MKKYFPTPKNKDDYIIPPKKGNYKNLSDMKPIFKKPRPQSRQPSRLGSSRPDSSLKSKLLNDKLPLPPITPAIDQDKFNEQTKNVLEIIKRFFKTTDPQTIKNIIENQREKRRDLLTKQNEAETNFQNFLLKKSKYETLIHNFSPIKVRDVLLITEGKAALSFFSSEKEIILQNLQNYQAQKNALMMSARHLCNLFELPEINDFGDLTTSFRRIADILKKSNVMSTFKYLQRGKVSFTIPDMIPSSRIGLPSDDAASCNSNNNLESSSEENVVNIPRISLASARGTSDFYPGTRSTRRALITFNSNSDFLETLSVRGNNDLQFFGRSIGCIFVDRYCLEISQEKKVLQKIENNCEVASLSPIFINKVNSYSSKEIMKNLADQYLKYQDYLFLSVLSDYEISKIEKSFMQFTSARDFLIQKFNEKFDEETLMNTFDNFVNSNDVVACWFIRDIILKCDHDQLKDAPFYFEKLVPLFQKRLFSLSSVTEIIKTTPFIAYFACFATFLDANEDNSSFVKHVLSLIDSNLSKIMSIFVNSMSSSISRCGFVSLFQIGKFCPQFFYQCIEFQNKAASDFLIYLRQNMQFTTCVREATQFFNKSFALLSRESSLFHTALIFHYSLMQLFNPLGVNLDVVTSLLSCLITVVANRNKYTNDQLIGLGFLQYLMKNFELEACLASSSNNTSSIQIQEQNEPIINNKPNIKQNNNNNNNNYSNAPFTKLNRIAINNNKSIDDNRNSNNNNKNNNINNESNNNNHKNIDDNNKNNNDINNNNNNNDDDVVNADNNEGEGKMRISYLNIPKMNLPHLNLENPKLQLHFKPYSSVNRNSVRSSISKFQYVEQRKRHPIYLSKELHVVYVQLMFALLIDHGTHRLDTFFCDPFPSVNRKPNVLFVLMKHMEGRLNQDIVKPLKKIFNPSFLEAILESKQNEVREADESSKIIESINGGIVDVSDISKNSKNTNENVKETKNSSDVNGSIKSTNENCKNIKDSNNSNDVKSDNEINRSSKDSCDVNSSAKRINVENRKNTKDSKNSNDVKSSNENRRSIKDSRSVSSSSNKRSSSATKVASGRSSKASVTRSKEAPSRSSKNELIKEPQTADNDDSIPSFIAQSASHFSDNKESQIGNFNSTNKFQPFQPLINEIQQYQDYMRLLRLTVPSCFKPINYSNGYHIGSGAFGAVMGVTFDGKDLAVKILEKSRNECDNPHLTEVYTEVSILEICKGDRRVTQLYDYGCSSDSYYIVMENYPTTLKAWRKSFMKSAFDETQGEKTMEIEVQNEEEEEDINSGREGEEKSSQGESNKNNQDESINNNSIEEKRRQDINNKSINNNMQGESINNNSIEEKRSQDINNKSINNNMQGESINNNGNVQDEADPNENTSKNAQSENKENEINQETKSAHNNLDQETANISHKRHKSHHQRSHSFSSSATENETETEEDEEEEEEDEFDPPPSNSADCSSMDHSSAFSTTAGSSCSHEWSSENSPPIPTLLRVYREFLHCCTILRDHRINHFDIKCDNVMLDTTGHPALGDFGESMLYNSEQNCYTLLNRGTEWIKSPEMLSIALDSSANSPTFDRLRRIGAGPASDVWSIGCLFFELITGEYLFIDTDWSRFFMRVTRSNEQILPEEKVRMLPDDPRFRNFIEFVLQRNVRRRPNLRQVIVKFDEMFPDASMAPLPVVKRRKAVLANSPPSSPLSAMSDFSMSPSH